MMAEFKTRKATSMELYTPEHAAKTLHVTVGTVRKWLRNGELTGAHTPAGWRLTDTDLAQWIERHRNKPNSPIGDNAATDC